MERRWLLIGGGVSLLAGILAAVLFIRLAGLLPLAPTNPLYTSLGVRKPMILGFVPYWLINKTTPESLAHLNEITYFGLELDTDGTLVRLTNPQEAEPGWRTLELNKFNDLLAEIPASRANRSLLIHLSNEAKIDELLTDPEQHATNLVTDVEPLMKQHGFTDLNLDIESFTTASPSARAAMATFLRSVRREVDQRQLGTLTVELTVASLIKEHLLIPEVVGEVSDRVVLMAYDFQYRDSLVSGAVAPVGGAKEKWEYDVVESVKLATQAIPAEKILLGIPLYGYEWETLSYQPESPVIPGTGKTSTAQRMAEILAECDGCQVQRDDMTGSPYLILPPTEDSAIQHIYFEDETSIQQKINLARIYKLGGVAFWAIGYETPELLKPLTAYKEVSLE